jgi:phosphatidylglycerophosphatase A
MNNHENIGDKRAPLLPQIIATAFGAGFWPWGPGTAGSFVGVLLWVMLGLLVPINALNWLLIALILLFSALGIWATAKLIPMWGDDPARVVIDEVVGVWVALLAAPAFELENRIWMALSAFILFRFFDILKPFGIKKLDQRKGAFWVMADDMVAGIYSLLILLLIGNIPGWDI